MLTRGKMRIISLVLLVTFNMSFFITSSAVTAAGYQPLLPKTCATTSIIVLDMTKDTALDPNGNGTGEPFDVELISIVIQGIVNRTSAQKIYFTHMGAGSVGTGAWAQKNFLEGQYYIDDGMLPVPKTYPTLDNTAKYPVLKYLLQNYGSYIKGKVKIPTLGTIGKDSAIMSGITACGFEDAVPVTDAADLVLSGLGYNFTQKSDTRSMTEVDAFNWAKTNYFTAQTSKKVIGYHTFRTDREICAPVYFDYLIANRAFIYGLDLTVASNQTLAATLINPSNYAYGTPVMTFHESYNIEWNFINGYPFEISLNPNYSVHSSFTSDPSNYTPQPAPQAVPIEDNTAYVAFYVTDGDSARYGQMFHYDYMRNSENLCPDSRDLPIGFSISASLLDTFPNFLKWCSNNTNNGKWEYISDTLHGDGVPKPEDVNSQNAYKEITRNYIQGSNTLFRGINFFNMSSAENETAAYSGADYWIKGYQGGGGTSNWQYTSNIASVNLVSGTQNTDPAPTTQSVRDAIALVPSGQPAFILTTCSDGGDFIYKTDKNCPFKIANGVAASLNATKPDGRKVVYLTPGQLSATWKAYKGYTPTPGAALSRIGWVATASNTDPFAIANALDGVSNTRWDTNAYQTNGQYFQVDMGSAKTFNRIRLDSTASPNDYPKGYSVYVSNDGINWGTAIATGAGSAAVTDITFTSQTKRYFKVVQTGSSSSAWWSIHELNVY